MWVHERSCTILSAMDTVTLLYCPMGCGQTISVSGVGRVQCSNEHCPDDFAIEKLLTKEGASTKHIVRLDKHHWSSQHPICERIDNRLLTCGIHDAAEAMRYFKVEQGTYEVWYDQDDEEWKWSPSA
jgi:Family of unknown function (DUF6085)